jgi:hypothetical protein
VEFKDKAGETLKPGDLIVYGKLLGRCAGLQFGKVLYLYEPKDNWRNEKQVKVWFIGVDDGWVREPMKLQKPSCLMFHNRVLKISRSHVSEEALKLLDGVNPKDYQKEEK